MNLIIFEGVSRTGKDTHIRKLLEYYNGKNKEIEIIHFTKPPLNTIESQFEFFVEQFKHANSELKKENKILIWNRSHLGEAVYSRLYRKWYYDYIWSLEKVYSNVIKNSILFLFNANAIDVINRDDGQSFSTNLTNKKTELKYFKHALYNTKIPEKKIIDISNRDINNIFEEIKYELQRETTIPKL
jgi:thymidylate kinase